MKDYEIGYRRPPKASQFKPGESGNKNGRRAKTTKSEVDTSNVHDVITREAARILKLSENGQPIEMTVLEAICRSLGHKSIKGDPRSTKLFFETILRARDSSEKARTAMIFDADLSGSASVEEASAAYFRMITQS